MESVMRKRKREKTSCPKLIYVVRVIATELCVGVVGMHSTGLGGGGFMLIRNPHGTTEVVDFRETAPAAAFESMYIDNKDASLCGGLARGLEYLHTKHAKLPWKQLFQPAINLAVHGFKVNSDLLRIISEVDDSSFLVKDPQWAIDFAPRGSLIKLGDVLTQKRLGDMLELISIQGSSVFYNGIIADAIISTLKLTNGTMSKEDLNHYSVATRRPYSITYRDIKITSSGAPPSGVVFLSVMKTLEGYKTLGDETLPIEAYDPKGIESLEIPGTSHVVAADNSGLVVTLTSTINLYFGSKVIIPQFGLIMNDQMNDFSTPGQTDKFGYIATPANYISPGKRPLSSMSPVIVDFLSNNTFYCALGASGGSHIITAVIQSLWNVIDRKMSLFEALKAPRFHDQLVPDETEFENTYDMATSRFMAEIGHNITWSERQTDVQAIRRLPNGIFEAVAEPELA